MDLLRGGNEKTCSVIINKNGETKKVAKGINTNFNFLLPSESTLKRWKPKVKYGFVIGEDEIATLKKFLEAVKFFGVGFDETDIREGLVLDEKTGMIYGGGSPFHYSQLKKQNMNDKMICSQILHYNLILPIGLNIPIIGLFTAQRRSKRFHFRKTLRIDKDA